MSDSEVFVLLLSISLTVFYLVVWFNPLLKIWPQSRIGFASKCFLFLPIISLIIYIYTLSNLASYDVVDSSLYKMFYLFMGYGWIYISMVLVSRLLDLSWKDDILYLANKSSVPAISGAYIAVSLIYAGANIGDGPGWWCVIIAGGIGLVIFFIFSSIFHKFTGIIEKVTIDRDKSASIRLGMYFIASGIILARASGGDWISLDQTIIDFWVSWPLVLLTILAIVFEKSFKIKEIKSNKISFLIGLLYIAFAVASLFYHLVLPQNPAYDLMQEGVFL